MSSRLNQNYIVHIFFLRIILLTVVSDEFYYAFIIYIQLHDYCNRLCDGVLYTAAD